MNDLAFLDMLYWFFMNNSVVLYSLGFITFLVFVIMMFTTVKAWGDGY
ncbi:hypothetical protein HD73_8003 (plasmid) [Bacillus thuringiensis serovar kurstaki str. HD73]|nr:hypothetical protein HD73_8003 [Bacillus thuringiensis serovar kurstaki str. HD73]